MATKARSKGFESATPFPAAVNPRKLERVWSSSPSILVLSGYPVLDDPAQSPWLQSPPCQWHRAARCVSVSMKFVAARRDLEADQMNANDSLLRSTVFASNSGFMVDEGVEGANRGAGM